MMKNLYKKIFKELKSNILKVAKNNKNLHDPYFDKNEIKVLNQNIKNTFVSTAGINRKIFERKISHFVNSKYAIAVNSGTEALKLSLLALDIKKNDEVLVPSLTFIGSVNAITYCGANPHFIDVKLNDIILDDQKLIKYLEQTTYSKDGYTFNKKTKRRIFAIIPVHLFGQFVNIINLRSKLKKYNIKILEDAAEALGSRFKKKHFGTFGDIGILSFNGNKIVTTGGGGAIITNKKKYFDKAYKLANVGKKTSSIKLEHDVIGFNSLMPALNASLGIAQFKKLNKFIKKKRGIHNLYFKSFLKSEYFNLYKENKDVKSNYWLQCIIIEKKFANYRDDLIKDLQKDKITTRPVWHPIHLLKPYKKCTKMNLLNTMKIFQRLITLPSSVNTHSK
jgi:perosamine synthetase